MQSATLAGKIHSMATRQSTDRRSPPQLIGGPYKPPRVMVGDSIFDERHGEGIVCGFTERLVWPTVKWGKYIMPVVCGDLVRAIGTESVLAVCHWWETSRTTVQVWKRFLEIGSTEGTHQLRVANTFTDTERTRAVRTVTSRSHRVEQSRVLKEAWRRRIAAGDPIAWTDTELALLGTDKDSEIGAKIGRSAAAVETMRLRLNVPPVDSLDLVCVECGKTFQGKPVGGRSICSAECKRLRKAKQLREWRKRQG